MNDRFVRRFFRVDRGDIAYLRFMVESYEGVLFLRTHDNREAVVEMSYSPSMVRDAEPLIEALATEMSLAEFEPLPEGRYESL